MKSWFDSFVATPRVSQIHTSALWRLQGSLAVLPSREASAKRRMRPFRPGSTENIYHC
jgi:hypothetical protein